MSKLKLGIVTGNRARQLMNAPAVAGGWIMVGCEASGRTRLWDEVCRMAGDTAGEYYLAAIPSDWDAAKHMLPAKPSVLLAIADEDIERASTRAWAKNSRQQDVEALTIWRARIYEAVTDQWEVAT